MLRKFCVILAFVLLSSSIAMAKDKKKAILPDDVLQARTVMVIVDPQAGIDPEEPLANRHAVDDVQNAFSRWGRFEVVGNLAAADLVVTVHKGDSQSIRPRIGGIPQNRYPTAPTVSTMPDASNGGPNMGADPTSDSPADPRPGMEVGPSGDIFAVYRGKRADPLESSAVWRYIARNSLDGPDVRAVTEFRKLMVEAEKQQMPKP